MYVYGTCLFYVCCSDCVGVCGNVSCVAAVIETIRNMFGGVCYFLVKLYGPV